MRDGCMLFLPRSFSPSDSSASLPSLAHIASLDHPPTPTSSGSHAWGINCSNSAIERARAAVAATQPASKQGCGPCSQIPEEACHDPAFARYPSVVSPESHDANVAAGP
jgi:hypothetical protein